MTVNQEEDQFKSRAQMLKSRAQMRMSEFILDISISPFPHPHCAPFLGAFSMCKDSLRKHQV